jgi:hypothetical protein
VRVEGLAHPTAAGEPAQHVGHGCVGSVLGDEPAEVQPAVTVAAGAPDLDPGHAPDEITEALDV